LVNPQPTKRWRTLRRRSRYNARCLYVPVFLSWVNGPRDLTGASPRAQTGQRETEVDSTGYIASALSAGILLTTIHTHDYKDVRGDAAAGRVTLPIAYPMLSRVVTAFILLAWSWVVSLTWRLDNVTGAAMGVLSLIVGISFVARRDTRADVVSSYLYDVSQTHPKLSRCLTRDRCQVWLCATYLLPGYYRLRWAS
jgi:hypothetical protein